MNIILHIVLIILMIAEYSVLCSTFEVSTQCYIWRRVIRTQTIMATFGMIGEYKEGEE